MRADKRWAGGQVPVIPLAGPTEPISEELARQLIAPFLVEDDIWAVQLGVPRRHGRERDDHHDGRGDSIGDEVITALGLDMAVPVLKTETTMTWLFAEFK